MLLACRPAGKLMSGCHAYNYQSETLWRFSFRLILICNYVYNTQKNVKYAYVCLSLCIHINIIHMNLYINVNKLYLLEYFIYSFAIGLYKARCKTGNFLRAFEHCLMYDRLHALLYFVQLHAKRRA